MKAELLISGWSPSEAALSQKTEINYIPNLMICYKYRLEYYVTLWLNDIARE